MTDQKRAVRWECHCKEPPFLLGTYDEMSAFHFKYRDRIYDIVGDADVYTNCPLCGLRHVLTYQQRVDRTWLNRPE